jgi:hypothetical protein
VRVFVFVREEDSEGGRRGGRGQRGRKVDGREEGGDCWGSGAGNKGRGGGWGAGMVHGDGVVLVSLGFRVSGFGLHGDGMVLVGATGLVDKDTARIRLKRLRDTHATRDRPTCSNLCHHCGLALKLAVARDTRGGEGSDRGAETC